MSTEKPDGTNEADNVETFICDGCEETVEIGEMFESGANEFCPNCYEQHLIHKVWTE